MMQNLKQIMNEMKTRSLMEFVKRVKIHNYCVKKHFFFEIGKLFEIPDTQLRREILSQLHTARHEASSSKKLFV